MDGKNTASHVLTKDYSTAKYDHLIFPAVLSTECLILDDSWETEWRSKLSRTAWIQQGKEISCEKTQISLQIFLGKRPHSSAFRVMQSGLPLTSSRFQVRLLKARGSRLSGARGRCSTGLPLISGALLVEITGGIFLKLRLSSNTRSTNWTKKRRDAKYSSRVTQVLFNKVKLGYDN